ncbi:MAG: hypothetical protein JXK93_11565 [Sphaerochaetaceae bacterium]|nr:hypothetical protein [Sphaerochaetaceae bacterium]
MVEKRLMTVRPCKSIYSCTDTVYSIARAINTKVAIVTFSYEIILCEAWDYSDTQVARDEQVQE